MREPSREREALHRSFESHWSNPGIGAIPAPADAVADHPELIRRWVIQTRTETHPRGPLWLTREYWRPGKTVEQRIASLLHGPHAETLDSFDHGEMAVRDPTTVGFATSRVLLYRRRIPGLLPVDEVTG